MSQNPTSSDSRPEQYPSALTAWFEVDKAPFRGNFKQTDLSIYIVTEKSLLEFNSSLTVNDQLTFKHVYVF